MESAHPAGSARESSASRISNPAVTAVLTANGQGPLGTTAPRQMSAFGRCSGRLSVVSADGSIAAGALVGRQGPTSCWFRDIGGGY